MTQVFMICGASGAGKTTHAIALAGQQRAVRFSIDPWMQTLYAADMKGLSLDWMMERVGRCERQIWQIAPDILRLGTNVVLDLGFVTRAQRDRHRAVAGTHGVEVALHFLDVPADVRRGQVRRRNQERDPSVFAFDVSDTMFDFMEPRFEAPDERELAAGGIKISPSDRQVAVKPPSTV